MNFKVTVQVLSSDNQVVAQHDSVPANWTRPTAGWLPGEVIVDPHAMTFRERYSGPALIEVGLYDPWTQARVPLPNGQDHVLLPVELTVLESD